MAEHNNPSPDYADINIKVKTPKRLVHYGDGVVEEFSEDETDTCQSEPEPEPSIDPSTLSWMSWFRYKSWAASSSTLAAVDYVGESLAYFFGITSPKYQLEISEYNRMQDKLKKSDEETKGWLPSDHERATTNQPGSTVTTV